MINRLKYIVMTVIISVLFQSTVAMAAESVVFSGKITNRTSGDYLTATVMKKGCNMTNPDFSDICWIDQTKIGSDDGYSLSVPYSVILSGEDFRTNYQITDTSYVSAQSGSDSNDGSYDLPYKTLKMALENAEKNSTIVLLDTVAVTKNMTWGTDKTVTVTGKNPQTGVISGGLDLTATVALRITAPAVFENMTLTTLKTESMSESANKLFACGNRLVMGDGLTMTNPVDILGGNSINNTAQNTDLTVKSGTYRRIYGGGENSPVSGNTNITIGDINIGYSANDDSSAYYDSRVFGGGKNSGADVLGDTNINVNGGTLGYVVGGGSSANVAGDLHINITGGRIMNVYGGTVDNTTVHSGNSYINMTGGTAESLFGGSVSIDFIGNTYVSVTGGEILRRIYGGCYNNYEWSWNSDYAVSGTTNVTIGKNAALITGGDLSSANKMNSGIFGGSRSRANHSEEEGIILFLNGAYEKYASKVGECSGSFTSDMLSHHDYIAYCGDGGKISAGAGRKIVITPDSGMKALVGTTVFFGGEYSLTQKSTGISFNGGYTIEKPSALKTETGLSVDSTLSVKDTVYDDAIMYAAVYSSDNRLIDICSAVVDGNGNYHFDIDFDEKDYSEVKLFIWNNKKMASLGNCCAFSVK